jgi:hypothetical protein
MARKSKKSNRCESRRSCLSKTKGNDEFKLKFDDAALFSIKEMKIKKNYRNIRPDEVNKNK